MLDSWKTHFDSFCKMYKGVPLKVHRSSARLPEDMIYISERIKKYIETGLSKHVACDNIKIYFSKEPKYFLEFLMFYIQCVRYILGKIKSQEVTPAVPIEVPIEIIIYLTNYTKTFPKDNSELGVENVNSGVTYHRGPRRHVYVYRKEEVFKVILHELIHAFNLDGWTHNVEDEGIQRYFHRFQKLYVLESLTDTLACIYNIIMFSLIFSKVTNKDYHSYARLFLEREKEYIICQSGNVLKYEGYDFNNNGLVVYGRRRENTHVLSYYVLKALNFYYMTDFFKWFASGDTMAYVQHLERCLNYRGGYWSKLLKCPRPATQSLKMSDIDINILVFCMKDKLLKTLRG